MIVFDILIVAMTIVDITSTAAVTTVDIMDIPLVEFGYKKGLQHNYNNRV